MDTSKEEIVNLRKQINRLKISLMFTQVLMIICVLCFMITGLNIALFRNTMYLVVLIGQIQKRMA